jgi:hypothetical protein
MNTSDTKTHDFVIIVFNWKTYPYFQKVFENSTIANPSTSSSININI